MHISNVQFLNRDCLACGGGEAIVRGRRLKAMESEERGECLRGKGEGEGLM
jgi:hypothetical protein